VSAPDPGWITIALLGKTRGNRGEVTALALSSRPDRYEQLSRVYLFGSGEPIEVESAWFHDRILVFKFHGIDTISDAERLSGVEVRVPLSERIALEPGGFFESDLVGCEIVDRRTGETLGRVTGWKDAGGSGLLEIDGDWLVPFARGICVDIDPASRRIAVELPEGLKDLNRT
jgi:16S rRNA processing protein RimM